MQQHQVQSLGAQPLQTAVHKMFDVFRRVTLRRMGLEPTPAFGDHKKVIGMLFQKPADGRSLFPPL